MKKYRDGKIKREHTVIEQVWPVLEQIAACEAVQSIIPGPINKLRSRGLEVTFQRFTDTGLRLLAKNGAAVQEVYLVSPEKEAVLTWLSERGIVEWKPEPPPQPVLPPGVPLAKKSVAMPADGFCAVCGRPILAGSRAIRLDRNRYHFAHVRCAP